MLILQKRFLFKVLFSREKCFYFRFLTFRYLECVKRFSNVGITDGMHPHTHIVCWQAERKPLMESSTMR